MQSTRRKKWFRRFIFLFLGLFIAYVYGCFAIADTIVTRKRVAAIRPEAFKVWEPVPHVPAWVSPRILSGQAKNVFIFSHGIKANRHFFAGTASELVKRGYDVVLLPMPGHDESPEANVGFGTTESKLIRQTLDAVKAEHIVLVGCSLGGAASWLASDHPRVEGIVTESAFGRFEPITHVWFNRLFPGGDIVFRPAIWIASAKTHLNPSDINPVETARKWDHAKPALVIHAGDDSLIPVSHGKELAEASGAEYWQPSFHEHSTCQSEETYVDRVESVMKRVLARV